jgi:hypothetical protein
MKNLDFLPGLDNDIKQPLLPRKELLIDFMKFCDSAWKQSLELVEAARDKQLARKKLV